MTKSKIKRLVKELIEKYGDKVVCQEYDWYKSRLIVNGETVGVDKSTIKKIKLSEFELQNRANFEFLEEQLKNNVVLSIPIYVEESKHLYESPEQEKLRKKKQEEFSRLIGTYASIFNNESLFEEPWKFYNPYWC